MFIKNYKKLFPQIILLDKFINNVYLILKAISLT